MAILGLVLDIPFLKSVKSQWVSMRPTTAICLILCGAGLALLQTDRSKARKIFIQTLGLLVCLAGMLTIILYTLAIVTGRDPSPGHSTLLNLFWAEGNRSALLTAILSVVSGGSLVLLAGDNRLASNIAHAIALPGATLSYLVVISYLLGVQDRHGLLNVPVALNTGIAFCAFFVTTFCTRLDTWLMSIFRGDHAGGIMARRLLPAMLLIPLLIGWLHLYGERSGLLLSEIGAVWVVGVFSFCLLCLVWLTAAPLNRADSIIRARATELEQEVQERKLAEDALREARDQLSLKVAERTAELVQINALLEKEVEDRKRIQHQTDATNRILRLITEAGGRRCFAEEVVVLLKEWTGCSNAGIRIVDDKDFIPYEAYLGFSPEFWQMENFLSLITDTCACTRTILGKPEPQDLACMTEGGSFVLNNSIEFLESLSAEEAKRFRGLCISSGFCSIAVIPINDEGKIIGAIHLTDQKEGRFPSRLIQFLERLTPLIGEGIRKFERKETLINNMARLEALNQSLHEFALIASHDLKEPLRKIKAFGTILSEKYKGVLGDKGNDSLDRMIDAAKRMNELIEALARYSKVTTGANPFNPTNLYGVVREAVSDIELAIRRKGGTVEIGELPTINADAPQMRQLFQNLISNAIKYQPEGNKPIIRVYGRVERDGCQIYVEDNGIGFDDMHVERIFKPFERLHGRNSRFHGTGMGLAICRKIVERHGGSIRAEGKPGKGSTFIIRLPVQQLNREGSQ